MEKASKKAMRSKSTGTKGRLLFLQKYLLEHTDDNHIVTTEDLLKLYKDNGYKCQRTTIPDDFAALINSGMDIIVEQVTRNETSMNAYHLGNRLFEVPELKMMIDAVSSSRFITAEKSETLVNKLTKLTNEENQVTLAAKIYVSDRLKTSNTNVFVNVDIIRKAIDDRKKISFHYWDYTPAKKKVLRHDGEEYVASPFALVWNDDRYYMVAFSDKHEKLVNFRVDRMCDVIETDITKVTDDEFNISEYSRNMIKMFDGNLPVTDITLLCANEYMSNVIDRFGEDIETEQVNEKQFRAKIKVIPSRTFFGWIVQYQGNILIESPEHVITDYKKLLSKIIQEQ